MDMVQAAAIAVSVMLFALGMFQVALIFGVPWGHLTWGGGRKVLPVRLRIASAVSLVIYVGMAWVLWERSGVVEGIMGETGAFVAAWVVAAYGWGGTALNAISRSPAEKMVMTPVALALAVAASFIALS